MMSRHWCLLLVLLVLPYRLWRYVAEIRSILVENAWWSTKINQAGQHSLSL
jgi:hypothetical protein